MSEPRQRRRVRQGDLFARDDWMRAVLADSDLSLTTRVVAVALGISVEVTTTGDWPTSGLGDAREVIKSLAASIGLPKQVVLAAINRLVADRYVIPYNTWRSRTPYLNINLPRPRNVGARS
jgi:hypothetical protein